MRAITDKRDLILDLSEDGKFAVVSAFRVAPGLDPSAALRELRNTIPDAEVQFLDGMRVAGTEHLEMAAVNALRAFRTGINISRSLAMETLLYASAQRQIDAAINMLGITRQTTIVGLVAFGHIRAIAEQVMEKIAQLVTADLDETLLNHWSGDKVAEIMTIYGIGAAELEAIKMPGREITDAVAKAVIERVALLSTRT